MKTTNKKTSKNPGQSNPPSLDNPGEGLPAEVTQETNPGTKTAADRFNDWEESKILSLLKTEFSGGGFITLQRRHPASGQMQWNHLGVQLPVDNFTVANIAAMFGGGDYRAKARPSSGQFAREFSFSIDHSIPPKNPMNPGAEKAVPPPTDVAAIIREIHAAAPKGMDSAMLEILKTAIARPEPRGETAAVLEMVRELREESRKSDDRFLKLFEALSNRAAPAVPSLREQLEDAQELIEMIGGNKGSGKDESWWKEMGKGIAESVGPLLKAHFAGGAPVSNGLPLLAAAPSTVTAPPALSPSAVPPGSTATDPNNPDAAMNPMLQMALNRFRSAAVDAARKGKDAYEFVDSMLGFVPDSFYETIYKTANAEDWFSKIFGADPEALKHVAFLNEVRNSILAKAFVAHSVNFATAAVSPEETSRKFLEWVSAGFHDELFNMTDPENWALAFEGTKIDPVWLESLRNFTAKALNEEADDIEPETGKTPVTTAAKATEAAKK